MGEGWERLRTFRDDPIHSSGAAETTATLPASVTSAEAAVGSSDRRPGVRAL
jgi:hypothetical protein